MKKIFFSVITIVCLQNFVFAQLKVISQNDKYGYADEEDNLKIQFIYDIKNLNEL